MSVGNYRIFGENKSILYIYAIRLNAEYKCLTFSENYNQQKLRIKINNGRLNVQYKCLTFSENYNQQKLRKK